MLFNLFSPSVVLGPVLLSILFNPWSSDSFLSSTQSPTASPSRFLILVAHPDDESFFFGPTITALTRGKQTGSRESQDETSTSAAEVFVLSLSTGNADALGETRKGEFHDSLDVYGIDVEKRWVLDKSGLQDNFTAAWDAGLIAETVKPYIQENNITTILTFDPRGISSHPNHMSLFFGASRLLSTYNEGPLRAYALITVPVTVKYVGIAAPILAKLDIAFARALDYSGLGSQFKVGSARPRASSLPVFVASLRDWFTIGRALRQHRSQLVWFRWLYMLFSRYMWLNEWVTIPAGLIMGSH